MRACRIRTLAVLLLVLAIVAIPAGAYGFEFKAYCNRIALGESESVLRVYDASLVQVETGGCLTRLSIDGRDINESQFLLNSGDHRVQMSVRRWGDWRPSDEPVALILKGRAVTDHREESALELNNTGMSFGDIRPANGTYTRTIWTAKPELLLFKRGKNVERLEIDGVPIGRIAAVGPGFHDINYTLKVVDAYSFRVYDLETEPLPPLEDTAKLLGLKEPSPGPVVPAASAPKPDYLLLALLAVGLALLGINVPLVCTEIRSWRRQGRPFGLRRATVPATSTGLHEVLEQVLPRALAAGVLLVTFAASVEPSGAQMSTLNMDKVCSDFKTAAAGVRIIGLLFGLISLLAVGIAMLIGVLLEMPALFDYGRRGLLVVIFATLLIVSGPNLYALLANLPCPP